jgi:prephenate dehydratase
MFWVDVEANLDDNNFQESLDDLEEFTYDIKIL